MESNAYEPRNEKDVRRQSRPVRDIAYSVPRHLTLSILSDCTLHLHPSAPEVIGLLLRA